MGVGFLLLIILHRTTLSTANVKYAGISSIRTGIERRRKLSNEYKDRDENSPHEIRKAQLEIESAKRMKPGIGGFFGLTSRYVQEHYERFGHILTGGSPMLIAENNPSLFGKMVHYANELHDDRVLVVEGDIIKTAMDSVFTAGVKKEGKVYVPRQKVYSYGHLDFTSSAVFLQESGFYQDLRRFATWWALTDTFYMDVTISKRGDKNFSSGKALVHVIKSTFEQVNWESEVDLVPYGGGIGHCPMAVIKCKFSRPIKTAEVVSSSSPIEDMYSHRFGGTY